MPPKTGTRLIFEKIPDVPLNVMYLKKIRQNSETINFLRSFFTKKRPVKSKNRLEEFS